MKFAEIKNLKLVSVAMQRLTHRADNLPALGVLYGASGYGKTTATIAYANANQAYFLRLGSTWTKKTTLEKICFELGIEPAKNSAACVDLICSHLAAEQRPLILDEADYLVNKAGMVELVRDIYEGSQTPILLVGEEHLPNKLKKFERFHGRVMTWIPAQPVGLEDAQTLAKVYAPHITIADDLLEKLVELAHGSVRRVVVNLNNLAEAADLNGLAQLDLSSLKKLAGFEFYTGEIPKRR